MIYVDNWLFIKYNISTYKLPQSETLILIDVIFIFYFGLFNIKITICIYIYISYLYE